MSVYNSFNIQYNRTSLIAYSIIIFLLDQSTKLIALNYLDFDREFIINQFVSFHRIFNQNTFLLNQTLPVDIWVYKFIWLFVALILTWGILWVTKQPSLCEDKLETEFARTGLFIILGGCLGNAFDVIFRYDGVIDFIRFNFLHTIPILNVADIMIYVGEFCLFGAWLIIILKFLKKSLN